MRLHLPIPPEWSQSLDAGRTVVRPEAADGLVLLIEPMEPLPPLIDGQWLLCRLNRDMPPDCQASVRRASDIKTEVGWPATIVDIAIQKPGSEQVGERRLAVYYRMLEYGALAEIRAHDMDLFQRHRARLLEILAAARPDWSGMVASLCQALEGATQQGQIR